MLVYTSNIVPQCWVYQDKAVSSFRIWRRTWSSYPMFRGSHHSLVNPTWDFWKDFRLLARKPKFHLHSGMVEDRGLVWSKQMRPPKLIPGPFSVCLGAGVQNQFFNSWRQMGGKWKVFQDHLMKAANFGAFEVNINLLVGGPFLTLRSLAMMNWKDHQRSQMG